MTNEHSTELTLVSEPLRHCPSCGSGRLHAVVETRVQDVHFLCHECGRCWNFELGWVSRVAPPTCFGCPERGRCEVVYARDHAGEPAGHTD